MISKSKVPNLRSHVFLRCQRKKSRGRGVEVSHNGKANCARNAKHAGFLRRTR